jgi:hypothetical protein
MTCINLNPLPQNFMFGNLLSPRIAICRVYIFLHLGHMAAPFLGPAGRVPSSGYGVDFWTIEVPT